MPIQVLENNKKPSFGQRSSNAVGAALQGGQQLMQQHQEKEALRGALGDEAVDLPRDFQKMAYESKLKQQQQTDKLQGEEEGIKTLEDAFGKRFADVFKASTVQGRSELLKKALDAKQRGLDINEYLSSNPDLDQRQFTELETKTEGPKKPPGMTAAEWSKEKGKHLYDINQPVLKELSQVRKNIPIQEQAIEDIKNASPDVGWRDYLAERYGFEPLRSSEGVKLKTAVKDFFLSDLTRAGSRPNRWIEEQLAGALPAIGRSAEANQITAAGLQFKVDLAKKRQEQIDDLTDDFGYSQIDLDKTASKMMKSYVVERQKLLEKQIREIKNKKENLSGRLVDVMGPDGQIYEVDEEEVESLPEGYRVQ
jgi:hypothetical protein